jgi:hypothetical protein
MVDYARAQATATRLITAYGVAVTLLKQQPADEYDPASGTADIPDPMSYAGYAVKNDKTGEYQIKDATDTRQVTQSQDILLSIAGAVPAIGDTLVKDGANWRVYGLTPIAPGPVTLFYEAGLALI